MDIHCVELYEELGVIKCKFPRWFLLPQILTLLRSAALNRKKSAILSKGVRRSRTLRNYPAIARVRMYFEHYQEAGKTWLQFCYLYSLLSKTQIETVASLP